METAFLLHRREDSGEQGSEASSSFRGVKGRDGSEPRAPRPRTHVQDLGVTAQTPSASAGRAPVMGDSRQALVQRSPQALQILRWPPAPVFQSAAVIKGLAELSACEEAQDGRCSLGDVRWRPHYGNLMKCLPTST